MAYTIIDDPSLYFQTTIYTGNGGSQDITNSGNSDLQPDWLWIKQRSGAQNVSSHVVKDSSRGVTKEIFPNATSAEGTSSLIDGFLSDGFSINNTANDHYNFSNALYVAWQWKCNGGTSNASASESGSNVAYNFQVNTTSKFMINLYTGTGSGATLNLGNQFTPEFMLFKNRSQGDDWVVYHHKNTSDPDTDHLHLNTTAATADDEQMFSDTNFAADEINLGTNHEVNADGENYVAYAFAGVQGYSKFGKYTGNGNADGTFVYTGFKPAWIMSKETGATGNWLIHDATRDPGNGSIKQLLANTTEAEYNTGSNTSRDILSNGFKQRFAGGSQNGNGDTHIYMAFAESPFVSSEGVPTTAR